MDDNRGWIKFLIFKWKNGGFTICAHFCQLREYFFKLLIDNSGDTKSPDVVIEHIYHYKNPYVLKSTAKKSLLIFYQFINIIELHMNVFVLLYRNIFLRKKILTFLLFCTHIFKWIINLISYLCYFVYFAFCLLMW